MGSTRPLVKICGLTRAEDALAAARAGADFLGMVLAAGSKRAVDVKGAKEIVAFVRGWYEQTNAKRAQTPQCGPAETLVCPKFVGVFVDEAPERMNEVAGTAGFDFIQLHGDEDPRIAARIDKPIIRAIRVTTVVPDPGSWSGAAWLLFDAASGGAGAAFDWMLLRDVQRPFLLAGGLNPDNVTEAIGITGAAGVDVATGVEVSPGIKDGEKVRAFIDNAKRSVVSFSPPDRGT